MSEEVEIPKDEEKALAEEAIKEDASKEEDDSDKAAAMPPPAAPEATAAPAMAAPAPAMNAPAPAMSAPPQAQAPAAGMPASAPEEVPASGDMPGMTVTPPTAQERAQRKTAEDIALAGDLKNGVITPKTYGSLFADKSLPGKIGTLFGLLLSGAGSGLSHQPNALLARMDKEIERDVQAQKDTQENKRNWYNASLQHSKIEAENELTRAHALGAGAQAEFDVYMNREAGIPESAVTASTMNRSSAALVQHIQDQADRMAPGPARDRFQAHIDNVLVPHMMAQAYQRNMSVEQKKDLVAAIASKSPIRGNPPPAKGDPKPGEKYDAFDRGRVKTMIDRGALAKGNHRGAAMKNAIPYDQIDTVQKEGASLQLNRDMLANAMESFHNISQMTLAGEAPGVGGTVSALGAAANLIPGHNAMASGFGDKITKNLEKARDTQMESLIGNIARRDGIAFDKAKDIVSTLMPSFSDTDDQRKEKFSKLIQYFKERPEENAESLKRFGVYHEMPKYKFTQLPTKEKKAPLNEKIETVPMGRSKLD